MARLRQDRPLPASIGPGCFPSSRREGDLVLGRRIKNVTLFCCLTQARLGLRASVAALVCMAVAGCKPSLNPQLTHTRTVAPQRDAAVVPKAPTVKAAVPTAPPAAVVEQRQAIPTSDKARKCEEICRIPASLHCSHQDECVQGCESMATGPICKAELSRMYDCLLRQPVRALGMRRKRGQCHP